MEPTVTTDKLAILPWLILKQPTGLCGVTFAPIFDSGKLHQVLGSIEGQIRASLKYFADEKGQPIQSGTFAFLQAADPGWSVPEADVHSILRLSRFLMLACYAKKKYFVPLGPYVNSAAFDLYYGAPDEEISFFFRRRDHNAYHLHYDSNTFHFPMPRQCMGLDAAEVDMDLLRALEVATTKADSSALDRIESALPFYALANREDPTADVAAQITMSVAAYEHLLRPKGSGPIAVKASKKLSALLAPYDNSMKVKDARCVGRMVRRCQNDDGALENAPIHGGWLWEFYKLRNTVVHSKKASDSEPWGWSPAEHLTMAEFVFPLVAKLLLHCERIYQLTPEDVGSLQAIDPLLMERNWPGDGGEHGWSEVLSRCRNAARLRHDMLGEDRTDAPPPESP